MAFQQYSAKPHSNSSATLEVC